MNEYFQFPKYLDFSRLRQEAKLNIISSKGYNANQDILLQCAVILYDRGHLQHLLKEIMNVWTYCHQKACAITMIYAYKKLNNLLCKIFPDTFNLHQFIKKLLYLGKITS